MHVEHAVGQNRSLSWLNVMNAPLHHSLSLYFGEQQNTLILQTSEQNSVSHTQAGKTSFFAEVTVP